MGDASLVEMVVIKVSPYLREDRPLLWLGEKEAPRPRLLPIAIGEFEAAAIQMQLEDEEPIRPISYDLLSSMLDRLKIHVNQVVIHTVRRSIYYAKVVIEKGHQISDIDSRPSDAVALALRTGAPIYVSRELLDKVGLAPLEEEEDLEHTLERFYEFEPQITDMRSPEAEAADLHLGAGEDLHGEVRPREVEGIASQSPPRDSEEAASVLTQLQARLQQAVICEEYEEAARLRDEIESLVNKSKT